MEVADNYHGKDVNAGLQINVLTDRSIIKLLQIQQ